MEGWTPNNGSVWTHYKGEKYQVLGLSTCEKTSVVCVVYARYSGGSKTYHRPLSEWREVVINEKNKPVLRYRSEQEIGG
jgi:hypothetical protein